MALIDERPIEDMSPLVFGPSSDVNPFKQVRLNLGLTQQEVADRCQITKHAVLRNEQGMASDPLPVLLNYYAEHFPISAYELRTQYERFQIVQRTKAGRLLGDELSSKLKQWHRFSTTSDNGLLIHPVKYLMALAHPQLNPTSLSKELCLNQSVINYFLTNPFNQQTIPEQLLSALKESGYNDDELSDLRECYKLYREVLKCR